MRRNRIVAAVVIGILGVTGLAGCSKKADTVNKNLATEGDSFNILRRVVFINGITDKYLLSIEGFCSVDLTDPARYSVTCRVSQNPETYKRDYLGKSDNVTMLVQQLDAKGVSANHYELVLRPEVIIPEPVVQ
jgi:hypothetical protein